MKKLFTCTSGRRTYLLSLISFLFITSNISAQVHSDQVLYANGQLSYSKGDWNYAAAYLYAFIQRNPKPMQNDPAFKKEVVAAYDHAMKTLNEQVISLKNCNARVASLESKNNDGVASITSGLGTEPPPLRVPSKVRFAATSFHQQQQQKRVIVDTSKTIKAKRVVVNQ